MTDSIFSKKVSEVRNAVNNGADPNESNGGFPAIIDHILDGNVSCVKALIELGANVNVLVKCDRVYHESDPIKNRIYNEGTPLDFAMCNYSNNPKKYAKIIDLLLAANAKNAQDMCLIAGNRNFNVANDKRYGTPWVDCSNNLLESCEVYRLLYNC
jgi:hypothetical protein